MNRGRDWCSYIPEMQGKAKLERKLSVLQVVKYELYILRK